MTEGERNGVKDVRDAKLNEDAIVPSQQRDYVGRKGQHMRDRENDRLIVGN